LARRRVVVVVVAVVSKSCLKYPLSPSTARDDADRLVK
jgi:hypothetical protein